jgi:hypothetical protein
LVFVVACGPRPIATPATTSPCRSAFQEDGVVARVVYRGTGSEQDVRVVGDFLPRSFFRVDWDPRGIAMTREGDDWVVQLRVARDARFDYRIVVDGIAGPDPANPRRIESGLAQGTASELVMPGYREPVEIVPRVDVSHGVLVEVDEPWAIPPVTVYLPPGYDASTRYRRSTRLTDPPGATT